MRIQLVTRYVGIVMLMNAFFMLLSVMVAVLYGFDTGFYPLLVTLVLTFLLGSFPLIFVSPESNLSKKESYAVVTGSWALSCLMGQLPYLMWGGEFTFINSWFEAVSGFTTTGSSILNNIEALPKSLLFWRSCTHLVGGVGIILFALVILPPMGRAKVSLSNFELSNLAKDSFQYRVQKMVHIILVVYAVIILLQTVLLRIAGMDWFDAVNHAFSTAATGGFSTRNLSIAYFNNGWIEMIIVFFMVVSGLHFGLLYATFTGKRSNVFHSEISRFYIFTVVLGGLLVSLNLWLTNSYQLSDSFRNGIFQFASTITTTGFVTTDTAYWPPFSILLLIFASIQCACSGSTSGGLKSDRMLVLYKSIRVRFLRIQHPNAIVNVRMNKTVIDPDTINHILVFIALYLICIVAGTLLLTLMNLDLMTSFSAIVSSIGNIGPGFGDVSSLNNFSVLPGAAKFICSIAMLVGRLELFGFIQLFFLKSWK